MCGMIARATRFGNIKSAIHQSVNPAQAANQEARSCRNRLSPLVFQDGQIFAVYGVECKLSDLVAGGGEIRMIELFLKVFGILADYNQKTLACVIGRIVHADKSMA